jgi:hypothetical protein
VNVLRSVLVSVTVAAIVFLVALPFMAVERWAGFGAVAVLAFVTFSLRPRLGLRDRLPATRAGFVIAVVLLLPARFFVEFWESGFDDGPFTGRAFTGDLSRLAPSERVAFRSGEIVIYNRSRGAAPVVAYRVGGRAEWAREMFVSLGERGENELMEITRPRITYGLVRDRLDFTGRWKYGAERGYALIWKWGGIQRFWLSW